MNNDDFGPLEESTPFLSILGVFLLTLGLSTQEYFVSFCGGFLIFAALAVMCVVTRGRIKSLEDKEKRIEAKLKLIEKDMGILDLIRDFLSSKGPEQIVITGQPRETRPLNYEDIYSEDELVKEELKERRESAKSVIRTNKLKLTKEKNASTKKRRVSRKPKRISVKKDQSNGRSTKPKSRSKQV